MLAKGIVFAVGDGGGPEAFNQIINCTNFALSGTSWATEATTNHDTTTPVETLQPTTRTEGVISLTLSSYVIGNPYHALLRQLSLSGAARNFKITYPGSTLGSFTFSGYVTKASFETPVNGLFKGHFDITVNGAITDLAATIASVTVTDAQAGDYVTGEAMTLSATFDEVVVVTGTPRIPISLTSGTVYATYVSGSGTNVLNFSKTFGGGDAALATHVSVTSPMQLNSGTILDEFGQAVTLTFTPPTTTAFHVN